jgi:hypothetical protein
MLRRKIKLGVVAHDCNFSTVQQRQKDQREVYSETLSQKKK